MQIVSVVEVTTMIKGLDRVVLLLAASSCLCAQDANLAAMAQAMAAEQGKMTMDATPKASAVVKLSEGKGARASSDLVLKEEERLRQEDAIKALKAKEKGPRRFAADLFETREWMPDLIEGGVSEDYVLGVGDQMVVAGFGSATFELPAAVDGRGEILIPNVGTVKVAGMSLGKAKSAIQGRINGVFSRTAVDVSLTKLRQVRVFVLGEVYKPGSYLVSSMASLINVLGLSGGPTVLGTFREIRVIRGGKLVHQVDLYPLRAEGFGNLNFALQNGDTLFVPLALAPVLLEGRFVRVAGREMPWANRRDEKEDAQGEEDTAADQAAKSENLDQKDSGLVSGMHKDERDPRRPQALAGKSKGAPSKAKSAGQSAEKQVLDQLPAMCFEMRPGESVEDALKYAGGLLPSAYKDGLTLRRQDARGVASVLEVPLTQSRTIQLQRGDVLSALPRRDRVEAVVTLAGWARIPGAFSRKMDMRVADLLKSPDQLMPDTYLHRGEILRTLPDGATKYLSFDLQKALAGDAKHNLLLEDRDRVELFRKDLMRPEEKVTLNGPLPSAGPFGWHEGMRVSDLVFKGGIPGKSANRMVCELARSRYGAPSEVRSLDLSKLLSTENASPVDLQDEALNPLLQPDDQVSIYEKPEFRIHRQVRISGQVKKPGTYILDTERPTLSQLIERAGGLTEEAMPKAGIFIRHLKGEGEDASSIHTSDQSGISEILERLNETKIVDPKAVVAAQATGEVPLLKVPVLHGLSDQKLNRVVVDFEGALAKASEHDIELVNHDEIIIPRTTDTAMIIGETATPFAFFKLEPGMKVRHLLKKAGGTTRNADRWNIRLLKADGRIFDSWVGGREVEPGDAVLVPQVVRRDTNWQENLTALTPLAILINAVRR